MLDLISGGFRISQTDGLQQLSLGQKVIVWQDFYWKLHENELSPLDPPMLIPFLCVCFFFKNEAYVLK